MRVSVLQPDLAWEDKSLNFLLLEKLILPLYGKTDLIILPELFSTGFTMNTGLLAEGPEKETYNWMKDIAKRSNAGICGSYIIKEEDNYYNRFVFVEPAGNCNMYDKRHLFSPGEENLHFVPGNNRLIFNYKGFRIAPYICYDLRFPVWSRNKNDTDLIIYVANWPSSRRNAWNILLKARAIENQCFVAASNRIGTDGMGLHYSGDSVIIDPRGEVIAAADNGLEQSVTADLSLNELNEFRNKFPVFKDSDSFTIYS